MAYWKDTGWDPPGISLCVQYQSWLLLGDYATVLALVQLLQQEPQESMSSFVLINLIIRSLHKILFVCFKKVMFKTIHGQRIPILGGGVVAADLPVRWATSTSKKAAGTIAGCCSTMAGCKTSWPRTPTPLGKKFGGFLGQDQKTFVNIKNSKTEKKAKA